MFIAGTGILRKFSPKYSQWSMLLRVLCAVAIGVAVLLPKAGMAHVTSDSIRTMSQEAGSVFIPLVVANQLNLDVDSADFELSTNPADPLLLRATRHDGKIVDYFGTRTEDGLPTSLDYVTIIDPSDDSIISISFDEGKPSNVTAHDGTNFEIFWLSDTDIRINVTTPDGEHELSLPFDLTDLTGESNAVDYAADSSQASQRVCTEDPQAAGLLLTDVSPRWSSHPQSGFTNLLADSTATLSISKCEEPFDPRSVKVRYKGGGFALYVDYAAYRVDRGVYQVDIPTDDRSTEIADVCDGFAEVLGYICTGISTLPPGSSAPMCAYISAELAVKVGPAAAAKFFTACVPALGALEIYCRTLGAGPDVIGGPDIAGNICGIIKEFERGPDEITLTPHAIDVSTGQRIFGIEQTFMPQGPFSDLSLVMPGTTSIENFMTEPFNPSPGTSYTAYVTVFPCLADPSATLKVTISVSGTDGYSDSRTVFISRETTVQLNVPGAEENVRDTITVEVEGEGTKTITIVF